jgi:membrane protease YdiL (CAAX protease family)
MSLAFLARARASIVSLVAPNAFLAEGRIGRTGWVRALGTLVLSQLFAAALGVACVVTHHAPSIGTPAAAAHPVATFVELLLSFGLTLAGLLVGVRFLQKRSMSSVLHVTGRPFRWRRSVQGFSLTLGLAVLMTLVQRVILPGTLVWSFVPGVFFATLPWAVVSLAVQTLTEEVLFRAWLPQSLAGKRQRVTLAVIVSAILFVLAHVLNPEMSRLGALLPTLLQYLTLSIMLSVVAVREEGIELSWGIHFASNLSFVLLSGMSGAAIPTVALFQSSTSFPWFDAAGAVLFALVVLTTLRRPKSERQRRARLALQSMR